MEAMMGVLIMGILILPMIAYLKSATKWILTLGNREKSENMIIASLADLEKDLKEMTEIQFCSNTEIRGYMDSYKSPSYSPMADPDLDTFSNRFDIDDDNDGLTAPTTMRQYRSIPAWVNNLGWRMGLDLADDDENGDGLRDVTFRYRYSSADKSLVKSIALNANPDSAGNFLPTVWTSFRTIASSVTAFGFDCSGGGVTEIDPNASAAPLIPDLDGNGLISMAELDDLGPIGKRSNGQLDDFSETRYVRIIASSLTIRPNLLTSDENTISITIRPPLMAVKEKFPQ